MASKAVKYFSSKKFRKDMAKVGANSVPYGNSTPSVILQNVLDEATETPKKSSSK